MPDVGTGALLGGVDAAVAPPVVAVAGVAGVPAGAPLGAAADSLAAASTPPGAGPGAAEPGGELESVAVDVVHMPDLQTSVVTVPLLEGPSGPLEELEVPLDDAETLVLVLPGEPPGAIMVTACAAPGSWTSN